MTPKGADLHPTLFPLRLFLALSLTHAAAPRLLSRSLTERSGFGSGGMDGSVLETIDSTSQWLLRTALRSRRARFGLFIYAVVLQVRARFARIRLGTCSLCPQMWVLFIIAFHAHQPIVHTMHKHDASP